MFETARLAWSKMTFDARSLQLLEKTLATATNLIGYPNTEEACGEKAISASQRTSQEARSTAIGMNLELLKKKDDDDEIYYFLKNELHGQRLRLQRHELSDEQTRLLDQLAELLDDFDYLCSPDNPDVPDNKAFESKRLLLTTKRDVLIKQIQYEITKPADASDTARSSVSSVKSPHEQAQHGPVKQEKHIPMKEDEPTPMDPDQDTPVTQEEPADLSESNLDTIQDFRSYTGANLERTKKVLAHFKYNLKQAVDWYFADLDALKPTDAEMDVDSQLKEAIRLSLEQESPGGECSLPADNSTTNDNPKGHAQLGREDAFTITKGEEQLSEDTSRRGRSHAGQPILLDAQGNFKSHVHPEPPTKSLWEQYRTMRKRLHVQYYGSSTWFDNPDPLRGIPTRERAEYVKPAEQTQDENDDDAAGGHKDVEQEKAAREYREKQEALRAERIADAADAEMVVELTDEERKAQETRDREYAESLHAQLNALDEAEQVANAAEYWDATGEWVNGTAKMKERAWGQDDNDSTRGNHSPAHSEHDSVIDDEDAPSKMDLDYIMEQAEENNRQNAKQGNTEHNSFVDLLDLKKMKGQAEDAEVEQNKYTFSSKEEEYYWDGYDSDAEQMDLDGNDMVSSDADVQGDADDEEPAFTPGGDGDAFMSSVTDDEQQILGSSEEEGQDAGKEKYASPMVFKPNGDMDVDVEDEEVKILKVDEENDVDVRGETSKPS